LIPRFTPCVYFFSALIPPPTPLASFALPSQYNIIISPAFKTLYLTPHCSYQQ
jgi:hypothetical protein